jgi:casein kinase II subunit alpha
MEIYGSTVPGLPWPRIHELNHTLHTHPKQVFRGIDTTTEDACIIKVLKPVAKRKIKREIKILRNLSGGPNVIGLLDVVYDPPSRSSSLIMEYVDNLDWKELFATTSELEIKHYVFQLLTVGASCFKPL